MGARSSDYWRIDAKPWRKEFRSLTQRLPQLMVAALILIFTIGTIGGFITRPALADDYPLIDPFSLGIIPGASSDSPALVGQEVAIYVNVTDADSSVVNLTGYWDYLNANFFPNPGSPNDTQEMNLTWDAHNFTWRGQAVFHHTYTAIGPTQKLNRTYQNNSGTLDEGAYFVNLLPDDGHCGVPCNPLTVSWNQITVVWVSQPLGNQPPSFVDTWSNKITPPNLQPFQQYFTANFSGPLGLNVSDPDGDPLNVTIFFGDGQNETLSFPAAGPGVKVTVATSHSYYINATWYLFPAAERFFTVRALLDDGHGHSVWAKNNLTVELTFNVDYGPRNPSFGYEPTRGDPPFALTFTPINFTASATEPEGEPLYYSWNFEGSVCQDPAGTAVKCVEATGANVTHVFTRQGPPEGFNVTLWVSDGDWKPANPPYNTTYVGAVRVINNTIPALDHIDTNFTVILGTPFDQLVAQGSDADGDLLTYTWDLGDGTVLSGTTPVPPQVPGEAQPFTFKHTYEESSCTAVVYKIVRGNETSFADNTSNLPKDAQILRSFCRFDVQLRVADQGGHTLHWNGSLLATTLDLPPEVTSLKTIQFGNATTTVVVRSPVQLVVGVVDPDGDPMTVTVFYGDGVTEVMHGVANGTFNLNHTYQSAYFYDGIHKIPAFYSVSVLVTDGRIGFFDHQVWFPDPTSGRNYSLQALEPTPVYVEPAWDFWDYSSLVAVFVVPAGLFYWSRRARLKEEEEEV